MYEDKKQLIETLMVHYSNQPEFVLLDTIERMLGNYSAEELKELIDNK